MDGSIWLSDSSVRLVLLRAVLLVAAVFEAAVGGVSQIFFARRASLREGRGYDPAFHGLMQDFGFYNLAIATLLCVAAVDPARHRSMIAIAIGLYLVHGTTHVLRYLGLYYGGETPLPTRPRERELKQGALLLAGAAGMILFFP
jgi:hypothetical protein